MIESAAPIVGHYNLRLGGTIGACRHSGCFRRTGPCGAANFCAGNGRSLWLSGGAVAMGIGFWSMHYVGMEALQLPVPAYYDWPTALVSVLAAVFASVALFVVSRRAMGVMAVTFGSIMMGTGIATMRHIGREAMRLGAMCYYSVNFVTLSVVLAILIAGVALFLTFRFRGETANCRCLRWTLPSHVRIARIGGVAGGRQPVVAMTALVMKGDKEVVWQRHGWGI